MVNLIPDKDIIYNNFVKNVYKKYLKTKYGISKTYNEADILLDKFKMSLVNWQIKIGIESAPVTNIRIITNLPLSAYKDPNQCNTKVQIDYPTIDESLIDIQTDGCITRVNIANPVIGVGYLHNQTTPSTTWSINHKLNYKPNVYTENTEGIDIEGIINHIDANNLTIVFSTAVAGKAYLS